MDDLLVRVDAQVSQFNAAFGSATKETLALEAALKKASAQQSLYQSQLNKYGAQSAQAQSALTRAQMSNARLAEQQAAIQAKAAAQQKAALQAQATAYSRLGRTYTIVGGAIALALGGAAKAAIDWEQAFTRVRQALDGSPEQIQAVESGLLDLAKSIPATTDQLADIARDASQLGVATPKIVDFTRVVAELSTTAPDLQDGATALARFLNVTGTSQSQVENVASTMTKLGQAGASTVSEIADLGLRLAGAGRTADLTDGEILGLANAMTSLGLRVETAGTNFSKTLLTINTAVGSGGKALKQFADVAGVSADQFAKAYKDDAAQAILLFLKGLNRVKQSGGDVASTLADMGITSQRQVDVLNRLSQSTDLVAASIDTGNQAFEDNTALQETFGKQAATTASQMQVAANNVHVLAIGLGRELLPVLGDAAGLLTDVASALGDIPGPAKEIVVILAAAAAATTLFSGAQLLLKARLIESKLALEAAGLATTRFTTRALAGRAAIGAIGLGLLTFGANASKSNAAVGTLTEGLGLAAIGFDVGGPFGAAVGGAIGLLHGIVVSSHDAAGAVIDLNAETQTLIQSLTDAGLLSKSSFQTIAEALQTTGAAAQGVDLGVPFRDLVAAAAGVPGALSKVNAEIDASIKHAQDAVTAQAAAINAAVSAGQPVSAQQQQDLQAAQALLARLIGDANGVRDALGGQNKAVADAAAKWKAHADAENAASGAAKELAGATKDGTDATKADTSAVQANIAAHDKLADILLRSAGGQIAFRNAVRDAAQATREATKANDGNTPSIFSQTKAGDALKSSLIDVANAWNSNTDKVKNSKGAYRAARQDFLDVADAMGVGDDRAKQLADQWLDTTKILEQNKPTVHVNTDPARREVDSFIEWINGRNATINVAASRGLGGTSGGPRWSGGYTGDGGKYEPAGIVHRGEFVMDKASTSKIGVQNLYSMMRAARGYASGGVVGGAIQSGSISAAELLKLLSGGGGPNLARVNALLAERNELEQREYAALVNLRKVRQDSTSTDKEVAAAEKRLQDARSASSEAMDKFKSALDSLAQTIKSRVDQVTALADPFGGEGTSLTAQGLLAKKRAVASDAREMTVDLGILRRKGADRDIIAELRSQGPTQDTLALLRSLIVEPRSYFRQLNQAERHVQGSARSLASFGIPGAHIGTQIQRQANVNIYGGVHVADRRGYERATRRAAERALAMT